MLEEFYKRSNLDENPSIHIKSFGSFILTILMKDNDEFKVSYVMRLVHELEGLIDKLKEHGNSKSLMNVR